MKPRFEAVIAMVKDAPSGDHAAELVEMVKIAYIAMKLAPIEEFLKELATNTKEVLIAYFGGCELDTLFKHATQLANAGTKEELNDWIELFKNIQVFENKLYNNPIKLEIVKINMIDPELN